MPAGTIEVLLIGAVGIKDTELFGKGDPYAVLFCGKQKLRSNTASNQGSKPIWNQKFSFYIDAEVTNLQIRVYNHNILTEDDELGSTTIPLSKVFAEGKLTTTSYNVVRPSGRVQGEVKLSISFTPKQRPGQQTVQDIPGPYNAKMHGSPYTAVPPEPTVKHDPLKGPNGYFKNNGSTGLSSPGSHHPHSFAGHSFFGSSGHHPPSELNAYPPAVYPPLPSSNEPYQRTESNASFQHTNSFSPSSDGSSRGRMHLETPSHPTDYTGNIYVNSPYGQGLPSPSPPPHLAALSHPSSPSMSTPPSAYPPQGHHNPSYPSGPSGPSGRPSQFQFENLAGNFGSLKISGNESESSSYGGYPGYHSPQSFSESKPPAGYPPSESVSGHFLHDHPTNGRPGSGYPPSGYPPPGNPSQYDSSHGEFPQLGSVSLYGYQTPPTSFYPQQLGAHQQNYGRPDPDGPPPPSPNSYPPVPYYDARPAHYVPAGYPK